MTIHRSYLQTLSDFSSLSCESVRKTIFNALQHSDLKLVVVDNDLTGIQTVHDCLLLTNWNAENLEKAFQDESPIFYIRTNTQSMTSELAESATIEAIKAVIECNRKWGYRLVFISLSDSTLHGHFPLEINAIRRTLLEEQLPILPSSYFVPAFFEAGRYTICGIHYQKDKDDLIPISETKCATEHRHSELRKYLIEKTNASQIGQITLEDLRRNSVQEIYESLKMQLNKTWITMDALGYDDLWKFSAALLHLLSETKTNALLSTSLSLPKAMSGMSDRAMLRRDELIRKPGLGLFIVGSYAIKSSYQLAHLLKSTSTLGIEVDVNRIFETPDQLLTSLLSEIKAAVKNKRTPVIYTSRKGRQASNSAENAVIGQTISDFLSRITQKLPFVPTYIVAKGLATSNTILIHGLNIQTATIAGQLLANIAVIKMGSDHQYPNMPYVLFPGNIGETDALTQVLKELI